MNFILKKNHCNIFPLAAIFGTSHICSLPHIEGTQYGRQGKNVTIEAKGNSTDDGVITLKANSKISLDAPKVDINGKQSCQINSEQKLGLKTNGTMDFYATQGTCESASSRYGKRGPSQVESVVDQAKGLLEDEMGGLMGQAEDLLTKAPGMLDQASDQLNKAMKDNLKNLPF